mgnify:FL=1
MMNNVKKTYIAPAAELILLAPLEALANQQTLSTGDQIALNKWGKNVFSPASVTSNRTYWGENGKINKK